MILSRQGKVLVGSLFLNVFLCGILAGFFMRGGFPPPHGMDERGPMQDIARVLPADKAAALEGIMRKHFEERREGDADIRDIRREMDDILAADNFDIRAFKVKAEEMHTAQEKLFAAMNDDLAQFFSGLSKEERRKLAEHFRKNAPPMGGPLPPKPPGRDMHGDDKLGFEPGSGK
ncbi:MAG TPA: periplasmic heavy metal sensor [Alphaproteobacteria bacterium]|nr:periplasmic heavy metal sensor [Alphaproteobacteria bacterium]